MCGTFAYGVAVGCELEESEVVPFGYFVYHVATDGVHDVGVDGTARDEWLRVHDFALFDFTFELFGREGYETAIVWSVQSYLEPYAEFGESVVVECRVNE